MMPTRARGRPFEGLTRSEDAVTLFKALRARGVTWDEAIYTVQQTLGTSESNVEKYLRPRIEFATADMEQMNVQFVMAKYWRSMISPNLKLLDTRAKAALLAMAAEDGRNAE